MNCVHIAGAVICGPEYPDLYVIGERGKRWSFEFNDRTGPSVTMRNGDIAEQQPGERSEFWRVVSWWVRQGKWVSPAGEAVWVRPRPMRVRRIAGNQYFVIDHGDDDDSVAMEIVGGDGETP